ncbi:MAG: hypothetical protein FWE35_26955 [Streptosporangiales bacterium]|nr:hypothetical protein [Streptosporangiales bacterium]
MSEGTPAPERPWAIYADEDLWGDYETKAARNRDVPAAVRHAGDPDSIWLARWEPGNLPGSEGQWKEDPAGYVKPLLPGPVRWLDADRAGLSKAFQRCLDLSTRKMLADAHTGGKSHADGIDPDDYPPLTVDEHLEHLALGEAIARWGRSIARLDTALAAGATWQEAVDATGIPSTELRTAYLEWASLQHKHGYMNDDHYAAVLDRTEQENPHG